jgi:thiamine biosynthesis lipoprotein
MTAATMPDERDATDAPMIETPRGFARRTFAAMGTDVEVLLPDDREADVARVEGLFEAWEATLSRFRAASELSQLNAAGGRPMRVSPLLFHVVSRALRAASATDGIFDPSVEPRMREIGYDRTFSQVAPEGAAVTTQPLPGEWRRVVLDRAAGTIQLPEGVGIDLGGIAKGMAVDAALALLAERSVETALVNAGGDLGVLGRGPADGAWPVSVQGWGRQRQVLITRGGLATSAVDRRAWRRGGREMHHLIDPRSGDSARSDLWSVTAAAASCAQAEVAAKVALILGRAAGTRFLHGLGVSGLLVDRSGEEHLAGLWATA